MFHCVLKGRKKQYVKKKIKVGVVNVDSKMGGVSTFIGNFSKALDKVGYCGQVLEFNEASLSFLNEFDILHFSDYYFGLNSWKLFFLRPRKVLTVHGWVSRETLHILRNYSVGFKYRVGALLSLSLWRFIPLLFDEVVCPSTKTFKECNLTKARVISNGIFPNEYLNVPSLASKSSSSELIFVTYSSIGGLKDAAVTKIVRVVYKLNQLLPSPKVTLLVFGVPPKGASLRKNVKFMDHVNQLTFLSYLKGSDLFITGKTFPDLGYTEMEAGALGIPVAKFTSNDDTEELIHGQTGILARDEAEMVSNLLIYTENIAFLKEKLGQNLRKFIREKKNWDELILIWADLFSCLLKK